MATKNHLLKTYGISFERKGLEGSYISQMYAYNLQDCIRRIKGFPELIHEYITDIIVLGQLGVDVIIEDLDDENDFDHEEENLDWLFKYFQKDIISTKEKEELKQYFLEKEYYEFLINF